MKSRWETLKAEQERREGIFHDVPETSAGAAARQEGATPGGDGRLRLRPCGHALTEVENELAELRDEVRPVAPETEPDPRADR